MFEESQEVAIGIVGTAPCFLGFCLYIALKVLLPFAVRT